jgi:hypothetical protein
MRTVNIRITPDSDERVVLESLEREVTALGPLSATDSLLVGRTRTVVSDFLARAHSQYSPGTTIQVRRAFELSTLRLCVHLDFPGKRGLLERLLLVLRGK